jgi:hypothetical protein
MIAALSRDRLLLGLHTRIHRILPQPLTLGSTDICHRFSSHSGM